jgi:hypothetical protein
LDLQVLVGQELGHHERRRAAVDDDRFAVRAHARRVARDGALARRVALDIVLERFARQGKLPFLR